ncbi:hypothetical protein GCM10010256_73740 [Streptomyces coeruleorubidus]|nr:hypothetical protein GCM10010256_73740 [Streptomyces coeruleorubidus]
MATARGSSGAAGMRYLCGWSGVSGDWPAVAQGTCRTAHTHEIDVAAGRQQGQRPDGDTDGVTAEIQCDTAHLPYQFTRIPVVSVRPRPHRVKRAVRPTPRRLTT